MRTSKSLVVTTMLVVLVMLGPSGCDNEGGTPSDASVSTDSLLGIDAGPPRVVPLLPPVEVDDGGLTTLEPPPPELGVCTCAEGGGYEWCAPFACASPLAAVRCQRACQLAGLGGGGITSCGEPCSAPTP